MDSLVVYRTSAAEEDLKRAKEQLDAHKLTAQQNSLQRESAEIKVVTLL
jgi:hypothetical protein